MKKLLAYIVLFFFIAVFIISSSYSLMMKIAAFRYEWDSPLGADNYAYGDLYGFSYLSEFRFHKPKVNLPVQISEGEKKIDFYCVCDSYIWGFKISDSLLYGVNKYFQARWGYEGAIEKNIDTSKINFLMIEISERQASLYLSDTSEIYSKLVIKNFPHEKAVTKPKENLWQRAEKIITNPLLKKNLEFNLYDYRLFTPVKELKAEINYKLFNRVNTDVTVSLDKNYLFYEPTVDSTSDKSSFRHVSDEEILKVVNSLNTMYEYYSKQGFKYIYFSIIPNPVSILEPQRMTYNNFVTRIQNTSGLTVPYINAYNILIKEPQNVYEKNDSHWNGYGLNLWMNELNKILKTISK